ncbi:hypothetical protein L1887_35615 [Cichorium endivia]|nr:hypothetical protein L1887_35615 [Cichorium endivia]
MRNVVEDRGCPVDPKMVEPSDMDKAAEPAVERPIVGQDTKQLVAMSDLPLLKEEEEGAVGYRRTRGETTAVLGFSRREKKVALIP